MLNSLRIFHRSRWIQLLPGTSHCNVTDNINFHPMKKIKNYFYLIVGVLSVLFAFTHAMNGQLTLLSEIDKTTLDMGTKTIVRYVWHIITAENLIFGVALIFMAFYSERGAVS